MNKVEEAKEILKELQVPVKQQADSYSRCYRIYKRELWRYIYGEQPRDFPKTGYAPL